MLVVWCPDWPAVAAAAEARAEVTRAVAVIANNRVIACTAVARAEGIRRGLRKREAQGRCPDLLVAQDDPDRDARLFEPVVTAVDATVPGVEVLRPGMLALSARGAARFFGSEEAAAERLVDAVAAVGVECQIGIADELSTAVFAARRATLVPPGKGAEFLAPMPVSALALEPVLAAPQRAELVDLLHRLGLRRIGDFAALTPAEVSSRFGADAIIAHRCARAVPERPPAARLPAADLTVEHRCDPPIERVDMAAFVGRLLATELHTKLAAAAVACTRLVIHAETEAGDRLSRIWRCAEPLTPDSTADRIRWQLDGWLTRRALDRGRAYRNAQACGTANTTAPETDSPTAEDWDSGPNAAITLLRLEPVEVVSSGALQLGLWGGVGEDEERARRALIRVQSLLGGDSVRVGVLSGGRGPEERITMVTLGDEPVPAADPAQPWPGRLPEPAPALVLTHHPKIRLEAADGTPIWVTDRGLFTADPALLHWGSSSWRLTGWAGPWPLDDHWWAHRFSRGFAARAQVQIHAEDVRRLRALLLLGYNDAWHVEGLYE
ncbi:DNA polymerase Y family protein [Nocardia sp. ET3-3]|uniref:DNA polymerase Y family protein n=1 Tax=Nocardia terrae TaxID=2675851 RepID=A0A7K1UX01_9NOCA|nr:DNA polymerase Y family protein [Nocardia terrae]